MSLLVKNSYKGVICHKCFTEYSMHDFLSIRCPSNSHIKDVISSVFIALFRRRCHRCHRLLRQRIGST